MDFQFQPWERLTEEVTDGEADFRFPLQRRGSQCDCSLSRGQFVFDYDENNFNDDLEDVYYATLVAEQNPDLHAWDCAFAIFHRVERDWLVRHCGRWAWIRAVESAPREWNRWLFSPPIYRYPENSNHFAGNASYMIRNSWAHFRLWVLRAQPLLFVTWNAVDGWRLRTDLERAASQPGGDLSAPTFQLQTPDVEQTPSSELFSILQTAWHDENSDLSAAIRLSARFAGLTELERGLLFIETTRGTPQQMIVLARAALQFSPWSRWCERTSTEINAVEIGFFATETEDLLTVPTWDECDDRPLYSETEAEILARIARVFQPRGLAADSELMIEMKRRLPSVWPTGFNVRVSAPSMHERIEASAKLRDFFREHWPAGARHLDEMI